MRARDIMTTEVATVPPDLSVQKIARLMADKKVSGVPVLSPSKGVLGMVSEADLLHRAELGTEERPTRWADSYTKPNEMARKFIKSHGATAHDVMAKPVVSVQSDADLTTVASTLDQHGIKRVPVLEDGKLIGIISRSDLVRAFGRTGAAAGGKVHLGDASVHKAITDAMRNLPWLDTSYINVTVNEGIVRVAGYVQSADHQEAIRIMVGEVPGVERLEQKLEVGMPALSWDGQLVRDHMLQ